MRRHLLSAIVLAAFPLGLQGQGRFDFSIANMMRGPELYGREPGSPRFTPDAAWIYFQWLPPGTAWNEPLKPWRVQARPGAAPEALSPAHMDSVAPLLAAGSLSPDRARRVVSVGGDLWLVDMRASTARRLTHTPPINESSPAFSADGRTVYFVREGSNVMSLDLATPTIAQLTDVRPAPAPPTPPRLDPQRAALEGDQKLLFEAVRERARTDSIARADREADEAARPRALYLLPNERITSLSVSPAGRSLLFTTTFATPGARQAIVPNYVTLSGYTEDIVIRSKVGDTQGGGRAGFMELPSGKVTWLRPHPTDTSRTAASVRALGWNASGTTALLFVEQSDFKARHLYTVDGANGALRSIDVLRDSAWVGGPCFGCGGFVPGGDRVWFVSEADGYAHLYTMNVDGSDRRQLTQGKYEVLSARISDDQRWFELTTSEVSPFEQHFYRMPVAGGPTERITTAVGGHQVVVSPDGRLIADVYSQSNTPPELFVGNYAPAAALSKLTTSPTAEWLGFGWIKPEIVMIPASDGVQVPARIYRPRDMRARPNGAAVIFVHGAGYLHNVHNYWSSYSREYMFNQYLASRGYVVLDIDYRASAGYGRDWRTAIYRWMGGRDLADQVDGSAYLTKNFGIDPERIGLYGGSYGGFITLMALFNAPKSFGAGAALRSVTDWAHYNHGYTARILNQPQSDTLAYRRSSPIFFAEKLEDPLLMAHGMVDVNVHFQDIVRLTERFIELGKTRWELAVYPVEDHGFVRPDSWTDEYRRIFELFESTIRKGGRR
ncbi:MAG: S9 family peptidase [Gemmatimonadaceae bacterium]|nr:S9 family peptidase [Gemmatimonadaceae bacterium]